MSSVAFVLALIIFGSTIYITYALFSLLSNDSTDFDSSDDGEDLLDD